MTTLPSPPTPAATAVPLHPPAPARRRRGLASIKHRLHDEVFRRVHGSTLIYNTCWEDPRIDREVLALDAASRVVMITSAGCNALDYLLDDPAEIHAIDMNHRQNALCELKRAMIRRGDHDLLFRMFGDGAIPAAGDLIAGLDGELPAQARDYWRKNHRWFDPAGPRRSFYYHGGSGLAAWLLCKAILRSCPRKRDLANRFVEAASLEEQRMLFADLEPEIWKATVRWLVNRPSIMALLGVPRSQIRLILDTHPGGMVGFVKDRMRHVMTELPFRENYFWRVYMTGRYSKACCPNYLRASNLDVLGRRVDRLHTHTCTVSGFLQENPGAYTHFILLDHQDWLAAHLPEALREEWELIFANAAPGATVLMRSANPDLRFVPEDIRDRVDWDVEAAERLHLTDRVGTYASMHVGRIR